jgi:hypothetical protein
MINLTPFCGTDETRPYLMKPFSRGDFTYATDGHICVRVSRREDVPEQENFDRPDITKLPWGTDREYVSLAPLSLPPVCTEECDCFDGYEHDCPDCECVCATCNGTSQRDCDYDTSVDLLDRPFALRPVRLLIALPNLQIAAISDMHALAFTFDGGAGFLMALRGPHSEHIKGNS